MKFMNEPRKSRGVRPTKPNLGKINQLPTETMIWKNQAMQSITKIEEHNLKLPAVTMDDEMKTPTTPKSIMGKKLWKNCFFLTWNLHHTKNINSYYNTHTPATQFSTKFSPCIENDGRKEIDEENLLIKSEYV